MRGCVVLIQLGQTLRLIFRNQRVDNLIQRVAGNDFVQFIERQVNPVVGYASLRIVISANPLRTIAGADLQLAALRIFFING